jgi:hypothetical protein
MNVLDFIFYKIEILIILQSIHNLFYIKQVLDSKNFDGFCNFINCCMSLNIFIFKLLIILIKKILSLLIINLTLLIINLINFLNN